MSRRAATILILVAVALLVAVVGVPAGGILYLRHYAARNEDLLITLNYTAPWLVPSESIARNLDLETGSLVYSSLSILEKRRWPGARDKAKMLLKSGDSYTWLNAALYLAVFDDEECIPYLIRGLKHPAWRAHADIAEHLSRMTGEDHGTDFDAWRKWWRQTYPDSGFDLEIRDRDALIVLKTQNRQAPRDDD